MAVGILGYGVYTPRLSIRAEEYSRCWGAFAAPGVREKRVMSYDEDPITMAIEATLESFKAVKAKTDQLRYLYFASTTSPYEEKSISAIVAVALGATSDVRTADFSASPRAGTSALLAALEAAPLLGGGCAVAVASDAPLAAPDSELEHANGAAAVSLVVGSERPIAVLTATYSMAAETMGERFRRRGQRYTSDLGLRMSFMQDGMTWAVQGLLAKAGVRSKEIQHVAYYQPDGRGVSKILNNLGFGKEQLAAGEIASSLGNIGAASTLLSLTRVLEKAEPGQRIMVVGYGCGGEAFLLDVESDIVAFRNELPSFETSQSKEYVDYLEYLKIRRFLSSRSI